MTEQKFIFLDIDGTLLYHESGIPDSAKTAIQKARQQDHKVLICTGRCRAETGMDLSFSDFDGMICSSGAYVEIDQKILFTQPLTVSILAPVLKLLDNSDISYCLEGEALFASPKAMDFFQQILEHYPDKSSVFRLVPVSLYPDYGFPSIYKISLFSLTADLCEKIKISLPLSMNFTMQFQEKENIIHGEISCRSATKATGIDIALNYFHGTIYQTICFGDSMNDESMIKHCQMGVCMGNGDERLKVSADYICETLEEDGIYKTFQKFGLIGCDQPDI